MANVFSALNKLKTNIFGGPGNTGLLSHLLQGCKILIYKISPTGQLAVDPLGFSTLSYPMDVQQNFQNGHYMLFYVNVQDKTKYTYEPTKRTKISDYDKIKGENAKEVKYQNCLKLQKTGRIRMKLVPMF